MAKNLKLVIGVPTCPSVIIGDTWLRPKQGLTPAQIETIWEQCPHLRDHIIVEPQPQPKTAKTKDEPIEGDDK